MSSRSLSNCTCRKTCTPVGCVPTSQLLTLGHVKLVTGTKQLSVNSLKLRVTEQLGSQIDTVLGCNEVRKYNLASHFKHLLGSPIDLTDEGETAVSYGVSSSTSEGAFSQPQALQRHLAALLTQVDEPLLSSSTSEACLQVAYLSLVVEGQFESKHAHIFCRGR